MPQNFLTIEDLRNRLKCATSTIYRWIERDEFPKPIKIGGMARWLEADIEEFIENAVQRRNDAGPRPANIRRGRRPGSRNGYRQSV